MLSVFTRKCVKVIRRFITSRRPTSDVVLKSLKLNNRCSHPYYLSARYASFSVGSEEGPIGPRIIVVKLIVLECTSGNKNLLNSRGLLVVANA